MKKPFFSILLPVYNTPLHFLNECLETTVKQTFKDFELIIVDDASPRPEIAGCLNTWKKRDSRISVITRQTNGGIVAASNAALQVAQGEFCVLVDHDDLLEPDALELIWNEIQRYEDVDYLYTDEYHLLPDGSTHDFRKPSWSPERFRSQMYTCHISVIRTNLMREVGGFFDGYDGAQDYDLILRVTERARRISHISVSLYYWRVNPESFSRQSETKDKSFDSGRRAVQAHCDRLGIDAVVEFTQIDGIYRVRRRLKSAPLVSVVIPSCGSGGYAWGVYRTFLIECLRTMHSKSTYKNLQFVIVLDRITPPKVVDELHELEIENLKIVWYDRPFNFSDKTNMGVVHADGEYVLLLNDDTEIIDHDWCESMLSLLEDQSVGAVGTLLYFPDQSVQHAGHRYVDGNPTHVGFKSVFNNGGAFGELGCQREVSGVTAAALMTNRETFLRIGGMSNEFPNNYNDVDFCMKLRNSGFSILYTPYASMYHFESQSRDPQIDEEEHDNILRRWWRELHNDRFDAPIAEEQVGRQKALWRRKPKYTPTNYKS